MSATKEIRQALLDGAKLSNNEMANFGVGNTILSQIRSSMAKEGYTFEKERVEGVNYYFIGKRKRAYKKSEPVVEETTEFPALPKLLDQLQVAALKVDRKGKIGMTLRSAKYSWHVTIEGIANK